MGIFDFVKKIAGFGASLIPGIGGTIASGINALGGGGGKEGGGFWSSPGGAAAINTLGGLAGGIGAGIGSASDRKWQEEMRADQWKEDDRLRGELEKRLAPTSGYIGMSPHIQGDMTRAVMGNMQRYLGEDFMKKFGIDVGGYTSGEKLAKPEEAYMYRDDKESKQTGTRRPNNRDFRRFARRRMGGGGR